MKDSAAMSTAKGSPRNIPSRRRGRGGPAWLLAPASLALALLALASPALARMEGGGTAGGALARVAQSAPASLPVTLSIEPNEPGRPVPARFLGLSFEAAALRQLGGYSRYGNLVALLRSLGPGIIRFGGITSDEDVGWTDASTPPPPWASSTIDPADLRAVALLARRSGWRVLLTVGLAHYEPRAAAREVAAAHAALGSYLAAVEIGNEPEAYANHGYRPAPWLPQEYEEQVSDYREAIEALTPGVPIAGPDSTGSGSFLEWGYAEALAQQPVLLTGHHYPLGCAQTPPPSIESLLSPATRGRELRSLETYLDVSRTDRIPLRIDEAGSVSCGGVPGISDTFAAALWATGYITQVMSEGAAGINLEGNPTNCGGYTPMCAASAADAAVGRLRAQPAYYAMLLTRSLIGYEPLPTTISSEGSPNLQAVAFLGPHRTLKILLSDDEAPGSEPLAVRAHVGAGLGPARLLELTGAGQAATTGVLLDGRAVPASGVWREPADPPQVAIHGGYLSLSVDPSSAVLVSVAPASTRRRGAHGSR